MFYLSHALFTDGRCLFTFDDYVTKSIAFYRNKMLKLNIVIKIMTQMLIKGENKSMHLIIRWNLTR